MSSENEIQFRTLTKEGLIVNERRIKQSDIERCRFFILVPEHYRVGSCMCDNIEHRKMMTKEWGYKKRDFKDIPLR